MPKQYASVLILSEDKQQQTFLYRYLVEQGVNPRRIRKLPLAAGAGAGEQLVRREYPGQVRAIRSKSYLLVGLVTIIDADNNSVAFRHQQLDDALVANGQSARSSTEAIAVVVPKRNIETWIHYLLGETVNEEDAYARFRDEERRCHPAVLELISRCPNHLRDDTPPSLRVGCSEITSFLGRCDS